MKYTKKNIGYLRDIDKKTEQKLNLFMNKWNAILEEIPDWITNIDDEKFRFKGKDFESVDKKIQIKKNVLFNINSFNDEQKKIAIYSDFSINFNNFFNYSLDEKNNVVISLSMTKIEKLSEVGVERVSTKLISDFFSKIENFEDFNKKILYLYEIKDRKEKLLRKLTTDKKQTANFIFENYVFTTNEEKNNINFKEIESLLSLTIDLKIKNTSKNKIK